MPPPMPPPSRLDVVALTRQLVAIDSVNPGLVPGAAGEGAVAAFIAEWLGTAGFEVEVIPAAEDPARVSVLAVRDGGRPGRTVLLNGHLDTVGVEGMTGPFGARVDGDRLLGRGTSDMKGGLAGLMVAAAHLAESDAPGRVVLAFVADEEDGSIGTPAVLGALNRRGLQPDVCLVAEPTGLDLPLAHRGFAVIRVGLSGRGAHSSQPDQGLDVLAPLGRLLVAVSEHNAVLQSRTPDPLLGNGSLLATVVHGGSAPFTIAAQAEALIERRTLPGETAEEVLAEVQALVDDVAAHSPGLRASAELVVARDAWRADDDGPAAEFMDLLAASLPIAPARPGAPYWMESALWQAAGVPTVVCGPAGGGLHAVDEWVDLAQLQAFPAALNQAAAQFLAGR